jgi:hypothetical protein
MPIRTLEDSEMPQEGHPSVPLRDEAARQILKNLSTGEQPSLLNDQGASKGYTRGRAINKR